MPSTSMASWRRPARGEEGWLIVDRQWGRVLAPRRRAMDRRLSLRLGTGCGPAPTRQPQRVSLQSASARLPVGLPSSSHQISNLRRVLSFHGTSRPALAASSQRPHHRSQAPHPHLQRPLSAPLGRKAQAHIKVRHILSHLDDPAGRAILCSRRGGVAS